MLITAVPLFTPVTPVLKFSDHLKWNNQPDFGERVVEISEYQNYMFLALKEAVYINVRSTSLNDIQLEASGAPHFVGAQFAVA